MRGIQHRGGALAHREGAADAVEHHLHGTRFVTVSGDDADLVARLARAVAETVPTTPLDAVLDGLLADDATPRALCRGLHLWQSAYFLPLVFRVPPERPIGERERAAVARLLRHPERQVRLSTMLAVDTLQHVDAELRRLVLARRAEETELDFVVTAFERVEEQAGASVT